MATKSAKFADVQIDSTEENPCSPVEPDSFGIRINMPSEITLNVSGDNAVVPLCGVYYLPVKKMEAHPEPLVIHLKHIESDATYMAPIIDDDPSPDEPEPEPEFELEIEIDEPEDDSENTNIISYFNPNLLDHIDFPLMPGYYEIFVEYAEAESNVKTIKVNVR